MYDLLLILPSISQICKRAGAGFDCVDAMMQRYALEASGVEYHAFARSCFRRLLPAAQDMLKHLAHRLARREGASLCAVLQRLRARIQTPLSSGSHLHLQAVSRPSGSGSFLSVHREIMHWIPKLSLGRLPESSTSCHGEWNSSELEGIFGRL